MALLKMLRCPRCNKQMQKTYVVSAEHTLPAFKCEIEKEIGKEPGCGFTMLDDSIQVQTRTESKALAPGQVTIDGEGGPITVSNEMSAMDKIRKYSQNERLTIAKRDTRHLQSLVANMMNEQAARNRMNLPPSPGSRKYEFYLATERFLQAAKVLFENCTWPSPVPQEWIDLVMAYDHGYKEAQKVGEKW